MRITLSAAVTADGYLDDNSPRRLMISTPEDWQAVLRLRADCDAILVGAETLRRDNPALLLRDEAARSRRRQAGLKPDIAKAVVTRSGRLDPSLRFFTEGDADRYVFAPHGIAALDDVATVVRTDGPVTARAIVTALEKRGITHLLVEGGAQILRMFLDEGMADTLRLAVNPALRLGEQCGGAHFAFDSSRSLSCEREMLGGMEVATYRLQADTTREDLSFLRRAIEASRACEASRTCYRVGAVVVTAGGKVFTGHTHETSPTHHAEQEAVAKALAAGAELRGATIYSSMEPCSTRSSEPESCTQLIIRHGFARVVFALYEPACFVACRGALTLREAGIGVRVYPELGDEVRAVNAHLWV